MSHMATHNIKGVRLRTGGKLTRTVRKRKAHLLKAATIQCCLEHAHMQKLDHLQSALNDLSKSQTVEREHVKYIP